MRGVWKKRNGAKVRLAAKESVLIRRALRDSINTQQLVRDFLDMQFPPDVSPETVRAWCRVNVTPDSKPLQMAFQHLYVNSYTLGEDIAMGAIGKAKINKAPTMAQLKEATSINWDKWKPGNRAAANLLRPSRGLADLMDRSGVTIQGLNRTSLDRIGTALANALAKGQTPRTAVGTILEEIAGDRERLARQLNIDVDDILDDSERALTIAQTEMSRAVAVASRELYEESGVELVEWLVADPCDLCQENADVSPIGIGDTFPSGDTEPPAHPNCVCDIAPYVVDTRNIGEEALSFILDGED
jgi:hypothetical protein